jgi:hypothetical protein
MSSARGLGMKWQSPVVGPRRSSGRSRTNWPLHHGRGYLSSTSWVTLTPPIDDRTVRLAHLC